MMEHENTVQESAMESEVSSTTTQVDQHHAQLAAVQGAVTVQVHQQHANVACVESTRTEELQQVATCEQQQTELERGSTSPPTGSAEDSDRQEEGEEVIETHTEPEKRREQERFPTAEISKKSTEPEKEIIEISEGEETVNRPITRIRKDLNKKLLAQKVAVKEEKSVQKGTKRKGAQLKPPPRETSLNRNKVGPKGKKTKPAEACGFHAIQRRSAQKNVQQETSFQ